MLPIPSEASANIIVYQPVRPALINISQAEQLNTEDTLINDQIMISEIPIALITNDKILQEKDELALENYRISFDFSYSILECNSQC